MAPNVSSVALDTVALSSNDVLVVVSYTETYSAAGAAITGVSGGSLTWTQRTRSNASARGSLEVWSAQVTGTLGVTTVTVTYAATTDAASVLLMAVRGCDAARWDANASLPAKASNTGGVTNWTASVGSVSTSQARDLVLAMVGSNVQAAATTSVPAGFSLLDQVLTTGGLRYANLGIGMQLRAATQAGATIAWGAAITDTSGGASGEYVVAALTADPASVAPSADAVRVMVLA